jgi:hypothetical protein
MTLKEKFHQWLRTEPFSSRDRVTLREAQCEVIADEYAIEFAEWCCARAIRVTYFKLNEEELEQFKKEKGL